MCNRRREIELVGSSVQHDAEQGSCCRHRSCTPTDLETREREIKTFQIYFEIAENERRSQCVLLEYLSLEIEVFYLTVRFSQQ